MKNKIVFGKWEATVLLVNLMSTQIILGFPRLMAETAGTASWLLTLYVSIIAFAGFYIILKLYKNFEGKNILEISEYAGGNAARVVVGVILLAYLIFIVSVVLRVFSENMKVIALEVSPISFVSLFFITGMIIGAYAGIEAIVRFSSIVVPIVAVGFLVITIGVLPYYDFNQILPILGNGPYEVFGKGMLKLSIFSALMILFLITPYIKTHKNFKIVGYASIIISAIAFIWGALVYMLVFPYPAAIENFLPVYQLARLIDIGRFFQRVESVFMLIWAASALTYLSAAFFFIVHVFQKTFKLEYYRPLILPFAIIVFNVSLLPENLLASVELEARYFRNYIWIVTFILPITILLIANAKKKGRKIGKKEGGSKA